MIKYIKIELSLYGLEERNTRDVCQKIVENEFKTENDIELIESAGEAE